MRKKIDILFFLIPVIMDAILIEVSYLLSYWIRFHSQTIPVTKGVPPFMPYLAFSGFIAVVWVVIFYLSGLYDTKRNPSFIDEMYDLFKSTIIGMFIVLAPMFFYRELTFSRLTIGIGLIISILLLIVMRIVFRLVKIVMHKNGIGMHNAVIVGKGNSGYSLIEKINHNPAMGYKLVGQIVPNSEEVAKNMSENSGIKNTELFALPVLGKISDIPDIVKDKKIDTLIITFPFSEHERISEILLACGSLPVDVRIIPESYEFFISKIRFYEIGGITLLGIKGISLSYWDRIVKRIFDVILSSIFLICSMPLFLVISIAIKISSKGPLFYTQKRVGEDGKIFDFLKFRTMIPNAEAFTGPIFAERYDKRVTKIGRILRRLSLDEIPQLYSVLKGDMSLVGPRPERPEFVEKFKDEIPRYIERHNVKSGITGWAQVNGLRGKETSIKERVKYDLYYIENWSLGFDIKILIRTIFEIVNGKHAY